MVFEYIFANYFTWILLVHKGKEGNTEAYPKQQNNSNVAKESNVFFISENL